MSSSPTAIPEDVVVAIFLKLPVKSLVQLRCVSKSWLAIIDSPMFIRVHSNQSLKTSFTSSSDIFILSYSSPPCIVDVDDSDFDSHYVTSKELNMNGECVMDLVGYCRGMICLREFSKRDKTINFIICNPLSRESWKVKILWGWDFGYDDHWVFVYDHVNDDLKLVTMADDTIKTIEVYSCFRSHDDDSCKMMIKKKIDNVFPSPDNHNRNSCVFLDGTNSIHWIAKKCGEDDHINHKYDQDKIVAAFNFETESFYLVPLPEAGGDALRITALGSLKGCLIFCELSSDQTIGVWMMKDYGIKESRIRFASLNQVWYMNLIPTAYSKCCRKLLVMRDKKLYWYHLDKKNWRKIQFSGFPNSYIWNTSVCSTSLVRLKAQNNYDESNLTALGLSSIFLVLK
ncbi:hypothetical protein ACH5RR_006110 [Cinchona calisaya]|uniref:F-box domain-containing protein n=1 Tax=Cinchona calisaya TaxID=153742 RepID=A0ABD3AN59_9GENT